MNIQINTDNTVPWYFLIQWAFCYILFSVLVAGVVIVSKIMTGMEKWEK